MTNSINAPIDSRFPRKAAGRLSMISMLAISVGMVAAPTHAQDMTAPAIVPAPAPAPTILSPQPAPASSPTIAPRTASPPAGATPAATPNATPLVSAGKADDLARKGGFDPETVAPEALAQIESEQQARKEAAAKAAAKAVAAKPAPARTTSTPVTDSATQVGPAFDAGGSTALAEDTAAAVAATPMIAPVPEFAATPEAVPADDVTDWSLLAALAALLGVGGVSAYAVGRRRRSKAQAAAEIHEAEVQGRDPFPVAINEAIMPELRGDPVAPEGRPAVAAEQTPAQPVESGANTRTKVAFANFVADLPEFKAPLGKANRSATIGQRRVAAAPRPYLSEADLSRPEGYFMAHVDAKPTPQNPFLTRQNRLKRARALDASLTELKASVDKARREMDRKMESPRPLEPAFS